MKTAKTILSIGLIFVIALSVLLVGCGDKNKSGSTIDEPNITVEYLEKDYATQLLRDGAEHVFGNIEISEEESGNIVLNIIAKEYVEDAEQAKGFYIEDKNCSLKAELPQEARCTFIPKGVSLPQMMTTEQFVKAYQKEFDAYDEVGKSEYTEHKLYDMYIMEGQIQLILEKYIS